MANKQPDQGFMGRPQITITRPEDNRNEVHFTTDRPFHSADP